MSDSIMEEIKSYESLVEFRMTRCLEIANTHELACQKDFYTFVEKRIEEFEQSIAEIEKELEDLWRDAVIKFKNAVLIELEENLSVSREPFSIISTVKKELTSKATLLQLFKSKVAVLCEKKNVMPGFEFRKEFKASERIGALDAMLCEQAQSIFTRLEMPFGNEERKDESGKDTGTYLRKPKVDQPEHLNYIGAYIRDRTTKKGKVITAKIPILLDRRKLNFIFFGDDVKGAKDIVVGEEKDALYRQMSAIAANVMYQEMLRCSGDGRLEILAFSTNSVISGWSDVITREKRLPVPLSHFVNVDEFDKALAFIESLPAKTKGDGHKNYLAIVFLHDTALKGILSVVEKLALVNANGITTLVVAPIEKKTEIENFRGQFGTPILHPEGTEAESRYQTNVLDVRNSRQWEFIPWDKADDENGKGRLNLKLQTIQALISPPKPMEEGTVRVPIGYRNGAPFYLSYDSGHSSIYIHGGLGSGKTVAEWSFFVNIAENYTPDQANFYVIDFNKKGEAFNNISNLPHFKVCLWGTGMAPFEIIAIDIKNELDRRSGLFTKYRVSDISAYNSLRNKKPELKLEPLPKIFIVFDEARELSNIPREFVTLRSLLIKTFSTGRSRGVYFVLADQETIRNNHPELQNLIAYDLLLSLSSDGTRIRPRLLHLASQEEFALDEIVIGDTSKEEFEEVNNRRAERLHVKYKHWAVSNARFMMTSDKLLTRENMADAVEIVKRVASKSTAEELHICLGMSFGIFEGGEVLKTFREPAEISFSKIGKGSIPDSDKHLLVFDATGTDINRAFWKLFEQSILFQEKAKVKIRFFDPAGTLPKFCIPVERIGNAGELLQIAKNLGHENTSSADIDFEFTIVNLEKFSTAYNAWCCDPYSTQFGGEMMDSNAEDVVIEITEEDCKDLVQGEIEEQSDVNNTILDERCPVNNIRRTESPPTASEYIEAIAAAIRTGNNGGAAHYFIIQSSSSFEWVGSSISGVAKRPKWETILEDVSCLRAVRLAPQEVPSSLNMLKRTETEMRSSGRYYHSIGNQEVTPHETFIPYDCGIFDQHDVKDKGEAS